MANLVTRASAALDRGVARLMERRMAPRSARPGHAALGDDARARLLELAAVYGAGTLGAPSPFFPAPGAPRVALAPAGEGPLGTQVTELAFASDYEPYLSRHGTPELARAARDLHASARANHTAHARWWTNPRDPGAPRRPTIVLIHGWGGGHHWVTERTFVVPYWLRHGFDVAAFVLPYHGPRAGGGRAPAWPSVNPMRTNEGFGQAIFDLRALALFLRDRGAAAVGALGMSLGGYTTALWASVAGPTEPSGLDFAVAMIPAVSMATLMWQHGAESPMRRRAAKAGITEDLLAEAFAVHAPTTRAVQLAPARLAVIGGRGDRITPPAQARALAAHWGVEVAWFDGGHLAQLGRADALRGVRRQLCALDLPHLEPREPRR